jgi:hypothetical protein
LYVSYLFLKDRGSARIEFSCYDGILKEETLFDWIGDIKRYFEYENIQDTNRIFAMTNKRPCNTLVGYVAEI